MLPNGKFNGELDGKKVTDFIDGLDYTIIDTKERVAKVKEILYTQGHDKQYVDSFFEMYFDQEKPVPHFKIALNKSDGTSEFSQVCQSLQHFSNYILFNKESLQQNDYSDHPYLDGNDRLTLKKKEVSYDELNSKTDKNGVSMVEKQMSNTKNYKKKPPQKIEARDLAEIQEIKDLQDVITNIRENLLPNEESNTRKRFYMRMMKDLRREQIAIKNIVRRPIEFKGLMCDETHFDYDSDTGYYVEDEYIEVSNNRIDLANPEHIYNILNMYSDLKTSSHEDLNSDIRYTLEVVEELIDKVDLRDFEKDILIMKIDGLIATDILEQIKLKYGLEWSEPYLTKLFKNVIPKKLSEEYLRWYEDWFYLNKAKGDYKLCTKCKQVKLANSHHFGKDKRNKDGLKSICKECDAKR